jgi:hypothetical protein
MGIEIVLEGNVRVTGDDPNVLSDIFSTWNNIDLFDVSYNSSQSPCEMRFDANTEGHREELTELRGELQKFCTMLQQRGVLGNGEVFYRDDLGEQDGKFVIVDNNLEEYIAVKIYKRKRQDEEGEVQEASVKRSRQDLDGLLTGVVNYEKLCDIWTTKFGHEIQGKNRKGQPFAIRLTRNGAALRELWPECPAETEKFVREDLNLDVANSHFICRYWLNDEEYICSFVCGGHENVGIEAKFIIRRTAPFDSSKDVVFDCRHPDKTTDENIPMCTVASAWVDEFCKKASHIDPKFRPVFFHATL